LTGCVTQRAGGDGGAFPNVRVHDFQRARGYTDDFTRFKDLIHFSRATASEILADIAAERHRVR
jgi:hypothetical protein